MLAKDCMTKNIELGSPDMALCEAAQIMKNRDIGILPIADGDRLVGVITDRDITIRAVSASKDPIATLVCEIMTAEVLYCFEDEDLELIARNLGDNQIRRLPVLNRSKRLVGILALSDMALAKANPAQIENAFSRISEHTKKSPSITKIH